MKQSFTVAIKDIKLLIRDKASLFWVLIFPLMIAVLFGSIFGGSNGSSAIKTAIIDQDGSPQSKALVKRISASSAVSVQPPKAGVDPVDQVRKGDLAAYIVIPKGYGEAASRMQYATGPALKIGIDPSRKAETGMLQGVVAEAAYKGMSDMFSQPTDLRKSVQQDIAKLAGPAVTDPDYASTKRFLTELNRWLASPAASSPNTASNFSFQGPKVESEPVNIGNAQPTSFEVSFPQAILWGMLGVMSSFAISMVRERNHGTLIRLRVSPLSFFQILAGKGLACFLSAAGVMVVLLAVGKILFNIHLSSPGLLALAIGSGAFCLVGIMMLLSVLGKTEQAVGGSSWGVMITMAMFGGGMIPIFLMPPWMQTASNFSPLKWTTLAIEGAVWRGFTFQEMMRPCAVLIVIGLVAFASGVSAVRARSLSGS
jgi:ABC-2 type transport system permease protein